MKKLVVFLLFALAWTSVDAATAPRRRAVRGPEHFEAIAPFSVGLRYSSGEYIFTAKEDGSLWRIPYLPYALGNKMPAITLDVVLFPAEVVVHAQGTSKGVRFYQDPDIIMPFDPVSPVAHTDSDVFIPGNMVNGVVLDCPIQGLPNNDELKSIEAYSHLRHYVVVQGRYYAMQDGSVVAASTSAPIDGPDGFRVMLFDHYQDQSGQWFVPASQCLRDDKGNIITSNPRQRLCYVSQ
jgi:hypothetical protein